MVVIPHGQQSFHVRSFVEMVDKLNFEIDEYDRTRLVDTTQEARAYRGLNCAWTAWHVHDWLWQWVIEIRPSLISAINTALNCSLASNQPSAQPKRFGEAVAAKYRSIAVCRTIATAAKHGRADKYPEALTTRGAHVTSVTSAALTEQWFDLRVFDHPGGGIRDFDQLIKEAAASWTDFFMNIGIWSPERGWSLAS